MTSFTCGCESRGSGPGTLPPCGCHGSQCPEHVHCAVSLGKGKGRPSLCQSCWQAGPGWPKLPRETSKPSASRPRKVLRGREGRGLSGTCSLSCSGNRRGLQQGHTCVCLCVSVCVHMCACLLCVCLCMGACSEEEGFGRAVTSGPSA